MNRLSIGFMLIFLIGIVSQMKAQTKSQLAQCPNSPNCVCTQETRARKAMKPLTYSGNIADNKSLLNELILGFDGTVLTEQSKFYLHYEFTTKIGKFKDDVEFLFDQKEPIIHFRSASRKGYGDFGKNKRRMRKISKAWQKIST